MARIVFTGSLARYAGGAEAIDLDARNVGHLFDLLGARYPDLRRHIEEGLAIAIDGAIYQDAWLEPIPAGSEVHLLPRIAGG